MSDHDGTGANWNVDDPATATDYVSEGATELRDLRVGVEMRLNKEHTHIVTGTRTGDDLNATGGGEHLEGSARIHTAAATPTNRPTTLVVGAVDADGVANDIAITGNEAKAEGLMCVYSSNNYTLEVYVGSSWCTVGYINSNITLTTATTAGTIAITGTAASIGLTFTNASTDDSSACVKMTVSGGGDGLQVVASGNNTSGIAIATSGSNSTTGITITHSAESGTGLYVNSSDARNIPARFLLSNNTNNHQNSGIVQIVGSNTSGSGAQVGLGITMATDSGNATVFLIDAASASGAEYLFDFNGGEAGELTGHTAAGNSGFVSNSKGTFTLVGCIKMRDDAGATVYIPYGTIA
jgi:hypothetical protein